MRAELLIRINPLDSRIAHLQTNVVSGQIDLAALSEEPVTFDGGGLAPFSVYRLPETD